MKQAFIIDKGALLGRVVKLVFGHKDGSFSTYELPVVTVFGNELEAPKDYFPLTLTEQEAHTCRELLKTKGSLPNTTERATNEAAGIKLKSLYKARVEYFNSLSRGVIEEAEGGDYEALMKHMAEEHDAAIKYLSFVSERYVNDFPF